MHAKRFSSVKHSTQGFAGDISSLDFRTDASEEEGSMFFIFSVLFLDSCVSVSIVFDSVDDVSVSIAFLSVELASDDLEAACS